MADRFQTTRWSVVLSAARGEGGGSGEALEWLCGTYWYPLYAFVRRYGHDAEEARDLTQSFFLDLLERQALRQIDPALGRFRSFLIASIKHFLAHERDRQKALKRRGDGAVFRVDLAHAEDRYLLEPSDELGPDELFEARWARTVLDRTLHRIREEYEAAGKAELFRHLGVHLTDVERPYDRTAAALGMTEGGVRVAVHRLRRRLGDLLRDEVAQTIADPADLDAELRSLLLAAGHRA